MSKNIPLTRNPDEKMPKSDSSYDEIYLLKEIGKILIKKNITLVAHYYTPSQVQILAEQTGGIVSDSLEMARYGNS